MVSLVPAKRGRPMKIKPVPHNGVDREAVRRDFENTNLTMRELEAKHGVPRATIQRWSKAWARAGFEKAVADTTVKILARGTTKETKRRSPVTKQVANVILQTAEINAAVIVAHRQDVKGLREVAMRLAQELQQTTMTQEDLRAFFDVVTGIKTAEGEESGMNPQTKAALRAQIGELLRLHNRVTSMQRLADTFLKLQAMDRKAHDLDKETKPVAPEIPDTKDVAPEKALETWKTVTRMVANG